MTDSTAKKLVVMLANGANSDKSTVAFTIANAALSGGTETAIFLVSDGVELAREGACEFTSVRPFKKLDELIEGFVENGGVVWSCAPCLQHRGHNQDDVIEGGQVTGAGPMLEWISQGASTICL